MVIEGILRRVTWVIFGVGLGIVLALQPLAATGRHAELCTSTVLGMSNNDGYLLGMRRAVGH